MIDELIKKLQDIREHLTEEEKKDINRAIVTLRLIDGKRLGFKDEESEEAREEKRPLI